MNKKNYLLIATILLFAGCGDKIVKMNEYKDISYNFHPHSDYELENKTLKLLESDSQLQNKIERYSKKLDKEIDGNLNDILSNQNNSSIMNNGSNDNKINSRNQNNLFKDRFDALRLNR